MMIQKKDKYFDVENVTILKFGLGDILVADAYTTDHACVLFKTTDQNQIGKEDPTVPGTTSNDFIPEVVMTFDKPESIDVVIEKLQYVREHLLNKIK